MAGVTRWKSKPVLIAVVVWPRLAVFLVVAGALTLSVILPHHLGYGYADISVASVVLRHISQET